MKKFKISISYPPIPNSKGTPLLSQNRQFQWFSSPTYIYPVIPAYAATLLNKNGYEIVWDDAIASEISYEKWLKKIKSEKADLIVFETKTPVIKKHWKIINEIKKYSLKNNWNLKIALIGDHVTALPKESLIKSKVDYVLCGGDYDFGLLSLANHLFKKNKLEQGWYFRKGKKIMRSGKMQNYHLHNLEKLPLIDRELTKWKLYAYKNGNFKFTPGSYVMSARDCWWGRCTFCSWTTLFPGANFRVMSPKKTLDEIGNLINFGVKEIMEDSGTLPIGKWLSDFCHGMIKRGYNKKITLSCNMRINAISDIKIWQLMKKAGFRLILFGLESANQKTLNKINKNLKVEDIEKNLCLCKKAGLEPHITTMIGYPWENYADAQNTINLSKKLFKKGCVDTLQATILIPYPGTKLYAQCKKNKLLNFDDYNRFDQREQVMKSSLKTNEIKSLTQNLYTSFLNPKFILKKITNIKNLNDIKYLINAGFKVISHLIDFKNK